MKLLLVQSHPCGDSLCSHLAQFAISYLTDAGHDLDHLDLEASGFDPRLSAEERGSYYASVRPTPTYEQQRLQAAEGLVLLFPTWWFGPPAQLKGWFDRVWAPGIAFDHAEDRGAIHPCLRRLKRLLVVTTLGSPAWVDWVLMRRPLRRILRSAILGSCAPWADFEMLSLYGAERLDLAKLRRFEQRLVVAMSDFGTSRLTQS